MPGDRRKSPFLIRITYHRSWRSHVDDFTYKLLLTVVTAVIILCMVNTKSHVPS